MMLTGLQNPSKTLPLDGSPGKSQSVDSEIIQPVSFGEILKLKEKQLQLEQEVSGSSIAAALAALQTLSIASSLPMPEMEAVDANEPAAKVEPAKSSLEGFQASAVNSIGTFESSAVTPATERLTTTESVDPAPRTLTRQTQSVPTASVQTQKPGTFATSTTLSIEGLISSAVPASFNSSLSETVRVRVDTSGNKPVSQVLEGQAFTTISEPRASQPMIETETRVEVGVEQPAVKVAVQSSPANSFVQNTKVNDGASRGTVAKAPVNAPASSVFVEKSASEAVTEEGFGVSTKVVEPEHDLSMPAAQAPAARMQSTSQDQTITTQTASKPAIERQSTATTPNNSAEAERRSPSNLTRQAIAIPAADVIAPTNPELRALNSYPRTEVNTLGSSQSAFTPLTEDAEVNQGNLVSETVTNEYTVDNSKVSLSASTTDNHLSVQPQTEHEESIFQTASKNQRVETVPSLISDAYSDVTTVAKDETIGTVATASMHQAEPDPMTVVGKTIDDPRVPPTGNAKSTTNIEQTTEMPAEKLQTSPDTTPYVQAQSEVSAATPDNEDGTFAATVTNKTENPEPETARSTTAFRPTVIDAEMASVNDGTETVMPESTVSTRHPDKTMPSIDTSVDKDSVERSRHLQVEGKAEAQVNETQVPASAREVPGTETTFREKTTLSSSEHLKTETNANQISNEASSSKQANVTPDVSISTELNSEAKSRTDQEEMSKQNQQQADVSAGRQNISRETATVAGGARLSKVETTTPQQKSDFTAAKVVSPLMENSRPENKSVNGPTVDPVSIPEPAATFDTPEMQPARGEEPVFPTLQNAPLKNQKSSVETAETQASQQNSEVPITKVDLPVAKNDPREIENINAHLFDTTGAFESVASTGIQEIQAPQSAATNFEVEDHKPRLPEEGSIASSGQTVSLETEILPQTSKASATKVDVSVLENNIHQVANAGALTVEEVSQTVIDSDSTETQFVQQTAGSVEPKSDEKPITVDETVAATEQVSTEPISDTKTIADVDAQADEFEVSSTEPGEKPKIGYASFTNKSETVVTETFASFASTGDRVVSASSERANVEQPKEASKTERVGNEEIVEPVEKQSKPSQMSGVVAPTNVPVKEPVAAEQSQNIPIGQVNVQAAEVAQQVSRHLRSNFKSGPTSMHLQLNPKELGAIDVQMVSSSEGLQVTFFAEQLNTGKLLESQLPQLRESLVDSGVQLSGLNISLYNQSGQKGETFGQNKNFTQTSQRDLPQGKPGNHEASPAERSIGKTSEVDYLI